jgi:hypothetical protein
MRGTLKEADYCTEMPFTLMRGTLKEADYCTEMSFTLMRGTLASFKVPLIKVKGISVQ